MTTSAPHRNAKDLLFGRISADYYPLRWFDWIAAALLLTALVTAASRLSATDWTTDLSLVQTVAVLGVLAGLALGQSLFSPRTVFFFAFIFGLFTVPWQLGITLQSEALWSDRLVSLLLRLGLIIYQLINKLTIRDSLLFLVLMAFLFWGLSIHAGYILVRYGSSWWATIPACVVLLFLQHYDPLVPRRTWYLAFYIFLTLVLVARMTFIHQRVKWQANRTSLPPHLSLDFIRFTMLFASLIVIVAWTVPALAKALPAAERIWQPVRETWGETVDDLNFAFASLRSTRPVYSPIYGSTASLGRGAPLSAEQIFHVRAPLDPPPSVRFYWRARTFDAYQNGQWQSTVDDNIPFNPEDGNLLAPTGLGRWQASFDIVSAVNMGTIFTPVQPLWVSRSGQVQYAENPDGTLDISSFVAAPPIRPGEVYQVTASIGAPTVAELRQAGEDYPSWVTGRYLQLPDNLSDRTRQLAAELTANLETPYDKADAITQYLRQNITYVDTIVGEPQPSQEVIDWFLFDLREGFCNYYATAEVLLLRLAGVPARWSVGYAQGELITDETLPTFSGDRLIYGVLQKDAHAWPEVYFPGIGWVEFEPTVGQPNLERPLENPLIPPPPNLTSAEQRDRELEDADSLRDREAAAAAAAAKQNQDRLISWLAGFLAVMILLLAFATFALPALGLPGLAVWLERGLKRLGLQPPGSIQRWAERSTAQQVVQLKPVPVMLEAALSRLGLRAPRLLQRWSRYAQLPALARAYSEINRALSRLGQPASLTDTPAERAASLEALVPPAGNPARRLVLEYQVGTFSRQPADLASAQQAATDIRRLSIQALLGRLLSRFQVQDRRRPSA
jgi:transglutaminase-like putative cysteine protease